MRNVSRNTGLALFVSVLGAGALGYGLARVRADGVPTKQPLWYSGTVADAASKPLSGNYPTSVHLFEDQEPTPGHNPVCGTDPADISFVAGHFRMDVASCAGALQKNPDLYVELTVDADSIVSRDSTAADSETSLVRWLLPEGLKLRYVRAGDGYIVGSGEVWNSSVAGSCSVFADSRDDPEGLGVMMHCHDLAGLTRNELSPARFYAGLHFSVPVRGYTLTTP